MIDSHLKGCIRYITIERTAKANAITNEMLDELIKITRNSEKNKVLVFSGAGKIFSAGADLDEVKKKRFSNFAKVGIALRYNTSIALYDNCSAERNSCRWGDGNGVSL